MDQIIVLLQTKKCMSRPGNFAAGSQRSISSYTTPDVHLSEFKLDDLDKTLNGESGGKGQVDSKELVSAFDLFSTCFAAFLHHKPLSKGRL